MAGGLIACLEGMRKRQRREAMGEIMKLEDGERHVEV